MLRQYKLKDYKFRLVLWVLILSVIGIMVIGSADKNYQLKQIIGMGLGIILLDLLCLRPASFDCSTFFGNRSKRCKTLD